MLARVWPCGHHIRASTYTRINAVLWHGGTPPFKSQVILITLYKMKTPTLHSNKVLKFRKSLFLIIQLLSRYSFDH
jgi:hypothetical protein